MNFDLNDEQQMLRDSLRSFLHKTSPFAQRTAASRSPLGWRPAWWQTLGSELGLLGTPFPQAVGGFGGGPVETMLVMEELGRGLVGEPYLESVVMAGGVLRRVPGEPAAQAIQRLLTGEWALAPAWQEPGSRFALNQVATTARRTRSGWQLDGHKAAISAAPWANALVVTARTAGAPGDSNGVSLFLVEAGSPGLTQHAYATVDGRRAADLVFDGLQLGPQSLLGEAGQAMALVDQVADEAVAALCAEAVGVMDHMLQATLAYTRQRKQFGQAIGRFQVLQHRMVDMMMQLEMARSASQGATLRLEADPLTRAKAVSAAKVTVGQACRFVGQNAVQLHGGMGMSDEVELTHAFRRSTVIEHSLGTVDHHLARFARLTRQAA